MELLDVFRWTESECFDRVAEEFGKAPVDIKPELYAFWPSDSCLCIQAHIDVVVETPRSNYSYGKWDDKLRRMVYEEPKTPEMSKVIGPPEILQHRNVIWRKNGILGGDDRAGVLGIILIHRYCMEHKLMVPNILLTNKEESGSAGMAEFIKDHENQDLKHVFMILGLDRKGVGEYVHYVEPPIEVKQYIESFGFAKGWGSYSDGKMVASRYGIPNVNLSVGYYNNHGPSETVHLDELTLTCTRVCDMIKDPIAQRFGYKEAAKVVVHSSGTPGNGTPVNNVIPIAEAKRRKRCQKIEVECHLPHHVTYYPYFDYLLTDDLIKEGFHIVSSPGKAKSLEEWEGVFDERYEDDIYDRWRSVFGKARKVYVESGSNSDEFYLAALVVGVGNMMPYSAVNCETNEQALMKQKYAAAIRNHEQNEIDKAFAEQHGYCMKFVTNDCNGGCHGNRADCIEVGGASPVQDYENYGQWGDY